MKWAIGYLIGGAFMALWGGVKFLVAIHRIRKGNASAREIQRIEILHEWGFPMWVLFAMATWPLGLAIILKRDDDDDDDPQRKVPPEFR